MSSCESWWRLEVLFSTIIWPFYAARVAQKNHKVGKEQPAANSILGEDVLVGAQEVIPGQTSFQSHTDR